MLSNNLTLVFVYGTLKPGGYYHKTYCGEFFFEAQEATIRGSLFDFPQLVYPGAVEDQNGVIRGFLLKFRHPQEVVLSKLDHLEGYDPNRLPEENEYYRKTVSVLDDSELVITDNAWCYFMRREKISDLRGVPVPDGHWQG